jgi:hypothetical protein
VLGALVHHERLTLKRQVAVCLSFLAVIVFQRG